LQAIASAFDTNRRRRSEWPSFAFSAGSEASSVLPSDDESALFDCRDDYDAPRLVEEVERDTFVGFSGHFMENRVRVPQAMVRRFIDGGGIAE
jgi:hypothetical protein